MPGIAGIFHPSPDLQQGGTIAQMVSRMVHEPSFVSGHAVLPEQGGSLGWVCRPGSFSDGGPFWNENRTVGLIFAGEDFAARELMTTVERSGQGGASERAGDILCLYEAMGAACVEKLNGWFSGVLIDVLGERTILFNDRYGLGRIYFHESPQGFFFSSEAKSLLAVVSRLREIDERSLAEFFAVGCVLQNRTLFRDIFLLPAGSRWIFHRNGRIEREKYFRAEHWEELEPLPAETYGERLKEVFGRVAPRYLRGPGSAAMSLTGGLDSRMLLAWASASPGSLPCYTFGGPYRDCHDLRIARRLAAVAGQPHTTIPIGDDFFSAFADLAEQAVYLSDGNMDVSGAVEIYANRRAREIAPVRLTGNYGSEILRSNIAFRPGRLERSIFTPEFSLLLDEAAETYKMEAAGRRLSFIAFKQMPWHHFGRLSVEQSQITPRSPFLDNELVALAYQAPAELNGSPGPLLELIAAGNPALDRVPTDRRLSRRGSTWTDRLARSWREFTAKAEYAYDYGMPQQLAKLDQRLSSLRLERHFLGRHKFYHYRIWYKERLKNYLAAQADSRAGDAACYRAGVGNQLIQAHLAGCANRTLELHKLLTVRFIRRMLTQSSWAN